MPDDGAADEIPASEPYVFSLDSVDRARIPGGDLAVFSFDDSVNPTSLTTEQSATIEAAVTSIEDYGEVGFVFFDFSTGRGVSYNAQEAIYPASAAKALFSLFVLTKGGPLDDYALSNMEQALVYSDNDAYDALCFSRANETYYNWIASKGIDDWEVRASFYPRMTAAQMADFWFEICDYIGMTAGSSQSSAVPVTADTEVATGSTAGSIALAAEDVVFKGTDKDGGSSTPQSVENDENSEPQSDGESTINDEDAASSDTSAAEDAAAADDDDAVGGGADAVGDSVEAGLDETASGPPLNERPALRVLLKGIGTIVQFVNDDREAAVAAANAEPGTAAWFKGLLFRSNTSFIRDGIGTRALVYDKAGWIDEYPYFSTTDCGVVEAKGSGKRYLMVIMTGQPDDEDAEARVTELAATLYEQLAE